MMTRNRFWQGMGLFLLAGTAGTALGFQMKAREKTMKRTMNKAVRNVGNAIDSMSR